MTDDRCITICGIPYRLEDPDQSEDAIQEAIDNGTPITVEVAYRAGGLDIDHYMTGRLRIDPNHPCGRPITHAKVKEGRLPWPG